MTAGGTARVVVEGALELDAALQVTRRLMEAEEARPAVIALDLRQVNHLDSTGLRAVVDAAYRAQKADRRLVVVAPRTGPVGRLLELTLVTDHLEVVDDPAAAGV
jgi:anti-anti-sigma factor